MKQLFRKLSMLAATVAVLALVPLASAGAQTKADVCAGVGAAGGSCSESGASTTVDNVVEVVVNVLSTIVGIVAVIMIIIGGFKYITSSGDSSNVQSAKNTILFAIVGLIIVAMAQVITGFVLDKAT